MDNFSKKKRKFKLISENREKRSIAPKPFVEKTFPKHFQNNEKERSFAPNQLERIKKQKNE